MRPAHLDKAASRAFTLIELLIAVTVLGLGVLGLTALFAGAGRQQQLATQQSDAVRTARNLDALLSRRLNEVVGGGVEADAATTGAFGGYIRRGQWHPIPSREPAGAGSVSGVVVRGMLSVDLMDDGQLNESLYFRLDGQAAGLFDNNWDVGQVQTATATAGLRGPVVSLDNFTSTVGVVGGAFVVDLPHNRLDPGRFTINVGVSEYVPAGVVQPDPMLTFVEMKTLDWSSPEHPDEIPRINGTEPGDPALWPVAYGDMDGFFYIADPEVLPITFGSNGATNASWIRMQRGVDPEQPTRARVDAINVEIGAPTIGDFRYISSVSVEPYEYREDRLLALEERLSYVEDPNFPGGRRPERGLALLYRRTVGGGAELAIVVYMIEPLSTPEFNPDNGEPPFVPPDDFQSLYRASGGVDQLGVLGQVEMELRYDQNTRQYLARPTDAENMWAIERGQRVMMSAINAPVNPNGAARAAPLDPGADNIDLVEVTGQRTIEDQTWGVLTDAPRVGFASILTNLTSASATQRFYAWAVRPIVESNEAEWRLRPASVQVVRIGGGQ